MINLSLTIPLEEFLRLKLQRVTLLAILMTFILTLSVTQLPAKESESTDKYDLFTYLNQVNVVLTEIPCPTEWQRRNLSGHLNYTMQSDCGQEKQTKTKQSSQETENKSDNPDKKETTSEPETKSRSNQPPTKEKSQQKTIKQALSELSNSQIYGEEQNKDGFYVQFTDGLLFEEARAELTQNTKSTLSKIADVLKNYDNRIVVRGHTSTRTISTNDFGSNQELSEARAKSAAEFLVSEGELDKDRLFLKGLADRELRVKESDEQSMAMNRRVDFFVNTEE